MLLAHADTGHWGHGTHAHELKTLLPPVCSVAGELDVLQPDELSGGLRADSYETKRGAGGRAKVQQKKPRSFSKLPVGQPGVAGPSSSYRWALISFQFPHEAENCCKNKISVLRDGDRVVLRTRPIDVAKLFNKGSVNRRPRHRSLVGAPILEETSPDFMSLWTAHRDKIIESRGSVALPYVYNPSPPNGVPGTTTLDRNHSHYILVDDGVNEFGREVVFRQELLNFISFRNDVSFLPTAALTEKIRGQDSTSESN
jgi:hypothetical protein